MGVVETIRSNLELTLAQATTLDNSVAPYGEADFSTCVGDADGTPPSCHDTAAQAYCATAEDYVRAVRSDAQAVRQLGEDFCDADREVAEKLGSGMDGPS